MTAQARARLQIVVAAILWSLSGFFSKALTEPTALGVNEPHLSVWQIAFYRTLFAGLFLVPTLPGTPFRPRPLVGIMMACFAFLNISFMTAMVHGTAANAILLQYTAPAWLLLAGLVVFKESIDRRGVIVLGGGLGGITLILVGNWAGDRALAITAALASGVAYAAVLICLRLLKDQPANWLTVLNLMGSALVLLPVILFESLPTVKQLVWLALFGCLQFGLPYWLMARALHHVSALEAGLLTLLEPALNPVWAFLVAPATERPTQWTLFGGAMIGSLAIRYWPARKASQVA
ncbi:MAG: DMT family transporter [Gemmataceae bacterium]